MIVQTKVAAGRKSTKKVRYAPSRLPRTRSFARKFGAAFGKPVEGNIAFVGYFDVLGFRDQLNTKGGAGLARIYKEATDELRYASHSGFAVGLSPNAPKFTGCRNISDVVIFSDSGFAFAKDDSEDSLEDLCFVMNTTFRIFLRRDLLINPPVA
jgi:hypothetical protein